MAFPKLFHVRQRFQGPRIDGVASKVEEELASIGLAQRISPGDRVAITAGSRGIANISVVTKAIVDVIKGLGGNPFVVPAMGSHGGATADGQLKVLRSYGITEEFLECPILSSMETHVVCQSPEGIDIHFDKQAYDADHVIVCGRVKPHTLFNGELQSGLMKMLLIGLGKHTGAKLYHRAFRAFSFDQITRSVAATVIEKCRIAAGLAILENGYEQTAMIKALRPEQFVRLEPELLKLASQWMARLPFDAVDVLVVDRIGKNISGSGMDTNVIGRKFNVNAAATDEHPKIKKILVRGLTAETHGNATGIGLADLTTDRVLQQIDYQATRVNCITAGRTEVGMLPVHFPTEKEALEAALTMVGLTPPQEARLLWIPNTLELEQLVCSEAYLNEAKDRDELEIIGNPFEMSFDDNGELAAP